MKSTDEILNYQFAPGISAYGIDGKDGSTGLPGTAFFFSNYIIDESNQTDYNQALGKIKRNLLLSKDPDKQDTANTRNYIAGDIIIDAAGNINRLIEKADGNLYFQFVTTLNNMADNEFFKPARNASRIYMDSSDGELTGLDIMTGTTDSSVSDDGSTNTNPLLRVISATKNTNDTFNLLSLISKTDSQSQKYLNVTYNESTDSFIFDTNSNIAFDSSAFFINIDDTNTDIGSDYYKIRPYADPIGLIHKSYTDSSVFLYKAPADTSSDIVIQIPEEKSVNINVKPEYVRINTFADSSNVVTQEYIEVINLTGWEEYGDTYVYRLGIPDSLLGSIRSVSLIKSIEIYKDVSTLATDSQMYADLKSGKI